MTAEKKKTGRPSKYSPEIATEIAQRLSDGEPLRQICRDDHMPAWRTVYDWMDKDDNLGAAGSGLSAAIARAREIGQDAIAEEILTALDANPERILSEGGNRIDAGYVQLLRVRGDLKLKLLAKWNPKRYGDTIKIGGDADNPLTIKANVEIFGDILTNMQASRQVKSK